MAYNPQWHKDNRERLNALRKARRLKARQAKLEDKRCLNCTILLAARLEDKGRSHLYCRKCITEYKAEVGRHRCRRYYYSKKGLKKPKGSSRSKAYVPSWRTTKIVASCVIR